MDNSGDGGMRTPGFGGLPLDFELPAEERFAHGWAEWRQDQQITRCELQMVRVMNDITDLTDWHVQVFDEGIVRRWREDFGVAQPGGLSDQAWRWCVRELQDKAKTFERTGFVEVLNTGSVIGKADRLIPPDLAVGLAKVYSDLVAAQPHSRRERDIIDPSMYPLVFGKTAVLQDGGRTTLSNLYGTDEARPGPESRSCSSPDDELDYDNPRRKCVSLTYQRLPCEVEVASSPGDVRITSYISGLHPRETTAYSQLEKLIALSIAPWSACLIKGYTMPDDLRRFGTRSGRPQCGRTPSRIPNYGLGAINELPVMALSLSKGYTQRLESGNSADEASDDTESWKYVSDDEVPAPSAEAWDWAAEYLRRPDRIDLDNHGHDVLHDNWEADAWSLILEKALARQQACMQGFNDIVQPGNHLSYEDWYAGRYSDPKMANVFMIPRSEKYRDLSETTSSLSSEERVSKSFFWGPTMHRYDVDLQAYLRKSGLQVLVRMSGVELTPNDPSHDAQDFHLEGTLNEHIVATAILAVDLENIAASYIEFRQETTDGAYSDDPDEMQGLSNQARLAALRQRAILVEEDGRAQLAAQRVGRVQIRTGRLVVFPNVVEHRVGAFHLEDLTRAGHARFVTLHLCDPHYRLCSTRNVPAQQPEWWVEEVIGLLQKTGLPTEICALVIEYCGVSSRQEEALLDKAAQEKELCDINGARLANMMEY